MRGPRYDIYLIELEGSVAERVGVAFGMSGSPVYVDGKIVGALSHRFGRIPRYPIAGVTPIEDILEASGAATAVARVAEPGPALIATPVSLGGVTPAVRDWMAPQLEAHGLVVVAGGSPGRQAEGAARPPFAPGTPVGVQLVGGDMVVAATGTVTWVDGETVYAWGHPFLGSGRVELPMTAVEVVHTVSDMAGSVRYSNIGGEVGAIVEDRLTAIVGRTGVKASTIPMELTVTGGSYGERRYHFDVARHANFTPLLTGGAAANALLADTGFDDLLTVLGSGTIRLRDLPELPVRMAFSGDGSFGNNPALGVAAHLQEILGVLYDNPFAEPRVESIELSLRVSLGHLRYRVESLLHDRESVEPGEELAVQCVLRGYRGDMIRRSFTLSIPEDASPGAKLKLAVGSFDAVDEELGHTLARRLASAGDLPSIVRVLGERQSAHLLTAVLYRSAEGVVSDGVLYSDLPVTAARLLSTRPGATSRARAEPETLFRTELEMDGPVEGAAVAVFRVRDRMETGER